MPDARDAAARRRVAVLFTDLSDSTYLSDLLEGEDYVQMLDELRRLFAEAVARHGGTVNQIQGDGFQALFGYPTAGENDAVCAVEAALDMHEAVRSLHGRIASAPASAPQVHSGVHAGPLLTRQGDEVAARVELFGPAPGLAKHLSDQAGPDEIFVSAETLGPVCHLFVTELQRQVTLKGREQPVVVHRVTGRSGLRTRFQAHVQRGLVPFMGRRAELQRLADALARARGGSPGFVAVSAAAGVGKTRLAEECLQRAAAEGWSVLRGYCDDSLRAEPLQPFLQMLRMLFGLRSGGAAESGRARIEQALAQSDGPLLHHLPTLQQLLSVQAAEGAPASTDPQGAIGDLLASMAGRQPQLVFIDDWQWADLATRQLVHALRQRPGLPLLLLVTTRPLDQADAALTGAERVDVSPFNEEEARATINRLLPQADPFVIETILRQSGGNALYIEELCHAALLHGGSLAQGAHRGPSVWLDTLIESRVARLPPAQAQLLFACAVIGNPAPTWLLQGLTGCEPDDPRLRALAEADLLFRADGDETLRFKHGITRDVVYSSLGLHERRAMHRQLAQLIQARVGPAGEIEACESLAYHHGGASQHEQAAHFARMAGDKALAASALSQARAQYSLALEMLDRLPAQPAAYQAWRAIVRRLGFACVFDPMRSDLPLFDRAIARAGAEKDASGLAYAHYWRAYLLYALGDLRAAVRSFAQAQCAAAEVRDPALHAQLRATRGQALSAAADYAGALSLLEETAQAPAQRGGASSGQAFSLACRASVLGDMGRFDEAVSCFDVALESLPRQGHEVQGSVLCWRSGVMLWQGRWAEALQDAEAAQRVGESVSSLYLFSMSQALGAFARWRLGGGAAALHDLSQAAGWLDTRDKRLFLSLVHGWMAEALDAEGRIDEAREQALRALARRRQRDWIGAAMAARVLAHQAARQGLWRAAWRHLQRAERAAALRESAHEVACNHLCRARLLAACGDAEGARRNRDEAARRFDRLRMAWHLGQARQTDF